jgi:hypothetical protein
MHILVGNAEGIRKPQGRWEDDFKIILKWSMKMWIEFNYSRIWSNGGIL